MLSLWRRALRNPFYVPSTWLLHGHPGVPTRLADQVLPGSRPEEFFVPRGEKFVYGSTALAAVSAYSVLEYDAQRISSPGGVGYRYTWAVREGVYYP